MTRLVALLLAAGLAAAQAAPDWDSFDVSGLPAAPRTFAQQQLRDALARHKTGDAFDAMMIQRKLAEVYAAQGDTARAEAARKLAQEAEAARRPKARPSAGKPAQRAPAAVASTAVPARPKCGTRSSFSGHYYALEDGALQEWDFEADGSFYHAWTARGAGTAARSGERGCYVLKGSALTLTAGGTVTGFVTPGVGGRSTAVGGGTTGKAEVRRMTLKRQGAGIFLDGRPYKVRGW